MNRAKRRIAARVPAPLDEAVRRSVAASPGSSNGEYLASAHHLVQTLAAMSLAPTVYILMRGKSFAIPPLGAHQPYSPLPAQQGNQQPPQEMVRFIAKVPHELGAEIDALVASGAANSRNAYVIAVLGITNSLAEISSRHHPDIHVLDFAIAHAEGQEPTQRIVVPNLTINDPMH